MQIWVKLKQHSYCLFYLKQTLARLKYPVFFTLVLGQIVACSGDGTGLDAQGQPIQVATPLPPGQTPEPTATPNPEDLFTPVQTIFTARCTVCHTGAAAPAGLVLTEGQAYAALVNVASSQVPELELVTPNDSEASYLVRKIRGDDGIVGGQMPRNGPPFLSVEQIQTVITWVDAGAPDVPEIDPNSEFEAQIGDFNNYDNWDSIDYTIGATNIALGSAHQGASDDFSRRVFINPTARAAQDAETGELSGDAYPTGSILVKEIVTFANGEKEFADPSGLLAMVKRGGEFNPDHNSWEWFSIAPDGSAIIDRGGDLGMCGACHTQAALEEGGADFVFAHQSEFVAENTDFANYRDWALIDDRSDANPRLDNMAHGATLENSVRRVYKKQLYANPDTTAQGYPIGTILVKEVLVDEEIQEITAMVKRGGDFNPTNGYWEWFMLDPATGEISLDGDNPMRGADLMQGMCNGCHLAANPTSGEGIDFVFKHGGDPFNNNEEFVAQLEDFTNYLQWEDIDYTISDINGEIGGGHQGTSDDYSRRVYANDIAMQRDSATFAKGSILVKEITTWQNGTREFSPALGLVAMVKRGGNFNTDHNGWEWFELETDVSGIVGRGGDYRDNGCNNCHMQGAELDYTFEHPSEFAAQSADFANYQSWTQIDERVGENPLLGGMAHKGDDLTAVRRVYKKQVYAAPEEPDFGFPIGTIIVKEVTQGADITELAAMVKRGGDFNDENQNWEWFMLNPADATIMVDGGTEMRGADLMGGMCNSCHTLAVDGLVNGEDHGTDYVFYHEDDPVNDGN